MKGFNMKKIKTCLLTGVMSIVAAIAVSLGISISSVETKAETLAPTVYQTDGASVRVFRAEKDEAGNVTYYDTDKQGIRFHVEMGAGYEINGTPLFDVTQTNEKNGSFKIADGYKTYTLVIPTRLMGGSNDLTMELEQVRKIDTTEYWFTDTDGNWESVAYIHSFPVDRFTDELAFRGVVCDSEGTIVAYTPIAKRSLTWVAKRSYQDTINPDTNVWGSAELDETAATLIKSFIPTYRVEYATGETEDVLWGDMLTKVDPDQTYYNETHNETVDLTKPLTYATSETIKLQSTQERTFVFTGVEYTESGFNIWATLPVDVFAHGTQLEPSVVSMVTGDGETVAAKSVMVEISPEGTVARLAIGFDYATITNGTHLTMLKSSYFYYSGVLYRLESDYEFVYNNQTWEMPLGTISLGDIEKIENFTETVNGKVEENIRVIFKRDILVNGSVAFENGSANITRTDGTVDTINDGYYYWNQGEHMILEIPGPGSGNVWGEVDGDVLTIPEGTRIRQNGGFYEFEDTISATFNGKDAWIFNVETRTITAADFVKATTKTESGKIFVDIETAEVWTDSVTTIVPNNGIATYHFADKVTTKELSAIQYHGQNGHKVLRIFLDQWSETGEKMVLPQGLELWAGNLIYKLETGVEFHFVNTGNDNGMTWAINPEIKDITNANITKIYWEGGNIRYQTDSIWSSVANNRVVVDTTNIDGEGVVVTGSNFDGFYYYGGTNKLLELQGVNFSSQGGSATIKAGTILWLASNADFSYTGAYRIAEDLVIEVSGAAGSPMYKDIEVATFGKVDIASIANFDSHSGEIRFTLNSKLVSNMYGQAQVEGSATLQGVATTSAFVYAEHPTIGGYTGNTIIAFTGEAFGKAFQASAVRDVISIEAGTKIWMSNCEGYITVTETLTYMWSGSAYVDADAQHTVKFSRTNATVKIDGVAQTSSMTVSTGTAINFTVEIPDGYELISVTNAVKKSDGSYTVDVFKTVTVTVKATAPIHIGQEDVVKVLNHEDGEFRIYLDYEAIPELQSIASEYHSSNNALTFNGTVDAKVGGKSYQVTGYSYYGLLDGKHYQMIGISCDVASMHAGDYMTIKAGSSFLFGNTKLYVDSDITVRFVGITADFDDSLATLSVDGTGITNGETISKLAFGTSTIVFGWKDETTSAIYDIDVSINGESQGSSGTYTVDLTGDVTIKVVYTKRPTVTVNRDDSKYSIVGIDTGVVAPGQEITFTVTPTTAYKVTAVKVGNTTLTATDGVYKYTVTEDITISVTVTEKSSTEKKNEILDIIANNAGTYISGTNWKVENGNLKSTSNVSTIEFNEAFFALLKEYGYSKVTVTLSSSNSSASIVKGTDVGNWRTDTVEGEQQTISGAQAYTARTSGWGYSKANVTWTLSNLSFS